MISALPFAVSRVIKDEIYRVYTTDLLKSIGEQTAAIAGSGCKIKRYYDIIRTDKKAADERTGDEIAADVIASICGGDTDESI